jgi:hypothetical protein
MSAARSVQVQVDWQGPRSRAAAGGCPGRVRVRRRRRRQPGRGEAAQQGEFADQQPVQAQPQQVVGLVGVVDEFPELVEHVPVQAAEQGPVDVQGVGSAEASAGEQGQDVIPRPAGARA